jgi:hypothetical protein
LDIPYYNALDDGTMLLDNPPCLTCYLYLWWQTVYTCYLWWYYYSWESCNIFEVS